MSDFSFWVGGNPVQQGSMRAFNNAIVHTNKKVLLDWRNRVAWEAQQTMERWKVQGPSSSGVSLHLVFRYARPKSHFGTGRNQDVLKEWAPQRMVTAPDLDKLTRAVLDALTGVVYLDDRQVFQISTVKAYCGRLGYGPQIGLLPKDSQGPGLSVGVTLH